eukprot:1030824-Rhodomonas_salina.1
MPHAPGTLAFPGAAPGEAGEGADAQARAMAVPRVQAGKEQVQGGEGELQGGEEGVQGGVVGTRALSPLLAPRGGEGREAAGDDMNGASPPSTAQPDTRTSLFALLPQVAAAPPRTNAAAHALRAAVPGTAMSVLLHAAAPASSTRS